MAIKLNESSKTDFLLNYSSEIKVAVAKLKKINKVLTDLKNPDQFFESWESDANSGKDPLTAYDDEVASGISNYASKPRANIDADWIVDLALSNQDHNGTEPQFTLYAVDDLARYVEKKLNVSIKEGTMEKKSRVREGIISSKDGDKTFDQLYGDGGVQLDEADEEWAQAFARCFESAKPQKHGSRLREKYNVSSLSREDTLSTSGGALFDEEFEDENGYFEFIRETFRDGDVSGIGSFFETLGEAFHNASSVADGLEKAVKALRTNAQEFVGSMYGASDNLIIQTISDKELAGEIRATLKAIVAGLPVDSMSTEVTIPSNQRVKNDFDESAPKSGKRVRENALPENMVKDYVSRAEAERAAGGKIEINTGIGYVSVTMSDGSEYFFQDQEAADLLAEVPDNINREDYILAVAQGW